MRERRFIAEHDRIEQDKLDALRRAVRQGWADVSAGRFVDVADDRLEGYFRQLGCQAVAQLRTGARH
jgi:antitoxin ParD1/3/4